MRIIPILMIAAGVILFVAAKNEDDPRNVIFEALNMEQRVPKPQGKRKTGSGTFGGAGLDDPTMPPGTKTVTV